MPQHTVGLLGTRIIHVPTDEVVHPSNFGPEGSDLLSEWEQYLDGVQRGGGVRNRERFFTVESTQLRSSKREFECEVDYGSYGSNRRVRDSSTGSQTGSIGSGEVAGDGLRLIHRVPTTGLSSYIACEQIGRSNVTGVLTQDFKRWFGHQHAGYRIEVEYLEDADAWEQFLAGANLRELTFVSEKSADQNRAGRPTREHYDVRPGRRGDVLPRQWLDRLLSDGRIPAGEVLSIPVNDEDIEETRIVVEKDRRRRTVHIGDQWPRFTWEIIAGSNTRPDDAAFQSAARMIIGEQLRRLGIDE